MLCSSCEHKPRDDFCSSFFYTFKLKYDLDLKWIMGMSSVNPTHTFVFYSLTRGKLGLKR